MACDFKQVINSPLYSKPHIKGMYFLLYNFSNILMNNVFKYDMVKKNYHLKNGFKYKF